MIVTRTELQYVSVEGEKRITAVNLHKIRDRESYEKKIHVYCATYCTSSHFLTCLSIFFNIK